MQTSTYPLEATLNNLGRAQHKLRRYADAAATYRKALALEPRSAGACAGLGYSYHCLGELDPAIQAYHKALALKSDDFFCTQMLTKALMEQVEAPPPPPASGSWLPADIPVLAVGGISAEN